MKLMRKMMNKKGFTLIELIVVLAILAIILAIAVPRYTNLQEDSRKKADIVSAQLIIKSARLMEANENYTTEALTLAGMTGFDTNATNITTNGIKDATSTMVYLEKTPKAQSTTGDFVLTVVGDKFVVTYGTTPVVSYTEGD